MAVSLIIISIYTPPSTSPTYIPPYQAPKGLPDKSLDILGLRLCGSANTQQSNVHVNKLDNSCYDEEGSGGFHRPIKACSLLPKLLGIPET